MATSTSRTRHAAFNDQPGTVRLYVAPAGDPLVFGEPIVMGSEVTTTFRDFPKPLFLEDGQLLVAWHGFATSGARIYVARESNGWASEEASGGAPGVPCECCPLDLARSSAGDLLLAFRNNDSNVREMWAARSLASGAFSGFSAISNSEQMIMACPMQGPRLGETSSGKRLAVWSVRGPQNAGSVFMSFSDDAGDNWSGGKPAGTFVGDEPTLSVAPSGRIYLTGVTGSGRSELVYSDDDGESWSAPEALQTPDGKLVVPMAESGGGVAALAAVSSAGTVWLRRME